MTLRASSRPASTSSSLDVLEHDGDAGGGDGLGDLAAHGAGADDGGLEHEHGAAGYREPSPFSCHLGAEAPQRALQRLALRAADEQQVDERHPGPLLLERVVELERDDHARLGRREAHALGAADLLVLDGERLALARDVARSRAPARARARPACESHSTRAPARGQSPSSARDVVQAVDERRPAGGVVPQRLGLAGEGRRSTTLALTRPTSLQAQLAADEVEAGGDGVQARPELGRPGAGARPRRPR